MIFKFAEHSIEGNPALKNLPVLPGPPEYEILAQRPESLTMFLPVVYLSRDEVRGSGYQYLMEDLRPEFRPINTLTDIINAASALPDLHRALKSMEGTGAGDRLLRFDDPYFPRLLEYVESSLAVYHQSSKHERTQLVLGKLDDILGSYWRLEEDRQEIRRTIVHGDFNRSNIHLNNRERRHIKVVDWEWAGWDYPHSDYVSLGKYYSDDLEEKLIERVSFDYPQLTSEENKKIFRWCQIQRGLLDASFMANLFLAGTRHGWIEGYVKAALGLVLRSYSLYQNLP